MTIGMFDFMAAILVVCVGPFFAGAGLACLVAKIKKLVVLRSKSE